MFQVNNLTVRPNQTSTAILADGTTVTLTFTYRPAVQRWSLDVACRAFSAKGLGLSAHPNLLRLWRNDIPFGLQVSTQDGTDPFLANDLDCSAGPPRVVVTVLDQTAGLADVDAVEAAYFAAGAAPAY